MLHTVGGSDVMRDLSWNCDVGLAVDFDKFHLSSLMSVEKASCWTRKISWHYICCDVDLVEGYE